MSFNLLNRMLIIRDGRQFCSRRLFAPKRPTSDQLLPYYILNKRKCLTLFRVIHLLFLLYQKRPLCLTSLKIVILDKTVLKSLYTILHMKKGISEIIFPKFASEFWNIKKSRVRILLIGFIHPWFLTLIFRRQSSKKARRYGLCGLFIFFIVTIWSAWMESNHRTWRRRPMLYPLSYRHITLKLYQILLKFASVYVIIIMKFYWMNNFFKI